MSKTLMRTAVTLAVLLAAVSGFVAIAVTPALGVEGPQAAQGPGSNPASVQEEIAALRAEIAKINGQLNGRHEGSEQLLPWYCQSLSESALRSGFVPAACRSLK